MTNPAPQDLPEFGSGLRPIARPARAGAPADALRAEASALIEAVLEAEVSRSAERAADLRLERHAECRTERTADARDAVVPAERSEALNRAVNVAVAAVSLVILLPVMLLVALLVKLSSPGPVLYTQSRVGLDRRRQRVAYLRDRRQWDLGGKIFTMYKFRSMRVNAEADSGEVWAVRDDPRVTRVGRVIRRFRLDELPQLYNVLRGDMNIVGPRPERPSIIARLRRDIADYPLRHRAKPGITGWAQINHAYDCCVEDVRTKLRYDLEYLQRQCLAEDLRIMLRTVPVMFRQSGW